MCNFIDESKKYARTLLKFKKTAYDAHGQRMNLLNWQNIRPGHCVASGLPLTKGEMFPIGRAPRHMTKEAYEKIIYRPNPEVCALCGGINTNYSKLDNIREIRWHFCHECDPVHILAAGIAHGVPEAIAVCSPAYQPKVELKNFLPDQQKQITHTPMPNLEDVFDITPKPQPVPVKSKKYALPLENDGWLNKKNNN